MAERDVRCALLLRDYLDGIPLDLGSALLPGRSWTRLSTLLHVHLHARSQRRHQESDVAKVVGTRRLTKPALLALLGNLRSAVERLTWQPAGTQWADYVGATNYSDAATAAKRALVGDYVRRVQPTTVWDLGANTGEYSRVARDTAAVVCAFDVDPAAVERNYRAVRARNETGLLPLVLDLTNPSPAIGWANRERMSSLSGDRPTSSWHSRSFITSRSATTSRSILSRRTSPSSPVRSSLNSWRRKTLRSGACSAIVPMSSRPTRARASSERLTSISRSRHARALATRSGGCT